MERECKENEKKENGKREDENGKMKRVSESVDPAKVPKRTLFTGKEIPAVGIGTFGSDKYGAEEIADAVYGAVCCGYRLIDCASVYQNEKEIGRTLKKLFQENVVTREELFITSKVWNDMHGEGQVEQACRQSLQDLGLETMIPAFSSRSCSGM